MSLESNLRFSWDQVEENFNNKLLQDRQKNGIHSGRIKDVPLEDGFEWVYIHDIRPLSGTAGWLQVDFKNRKQGRYIVCVMS